MTSTPLAHTCAHAGTHTRRTQLVFLVELLLVHGKLAGMVQDVELLQETRDHFLRRCFTAHTHTHIHMPAYVDTQADDTLRGRIDRYVMFYAQSTV